MRASLVRLTVAVAALSAGVGCKPSGEGSQPSEVEAVAVEAEESTTLSPDERAEIEESHRRIRETYLSGDLDGARAAAILALEARPRFEEPYRILSKLHTDLGRDADAIRLFNARIARGPEIWQPWFYKGFHEWHLSRLDDAQSSFQRVIELEPELAKGWYRLALVLQRKGEFSSSADAARHSYALDAQATTAALLGNLLRTLGRYEEAEAEIVAAQLRSGESSELQHQVGLLRLHAGDLATAEKALRRATELDGRHLAAHETLARLLFRQGRQEEARAVQRKVDRLRDYELGKVTLGTRIAATGDAGLRLRLAELELTENRLRESLALLRDCEETIGPTLRILAMKAEALFRAGQLERAEALLARTAEPSHPRVVLARATGMVAKEYHEAAVHLLSIAAEDGPDEREFLRRIADLYALAGRADASTSLLERARRASSITELNREGANP